MSRLPFHFSLSHTHILSLSLSHTHTVLCCYGPLLFASVAFALPFASPCASPFWLPFASPFGCLWRYLWWYLWRCLLLSVQVLVALVARNLIKGCVMYRRSEPAVTFLRLNLERLSMLDQVGSARATQRSAATCNAHATQRTYSSKLQLRQELEVIIGLAVPTCST